MGISNLRLTKRLGYPGDSEEVEDAKLSGLEPSSDRESKREQRCGTIGRLAKPTFSYRALERAQKIKLHRLGENSTSNCVTV
jgi:hypothetical protein